MAVSQALVVELGEESPGARAWRRLLRRKSALFGLIIIVALVLVALLAPLIAPFDPTQQSWTTIRKPPSAQHWFGTDESGRDLLSRVMFGARASLMLRWWVRGLARPSPFFDEQTGAPRVAPRVLTREARERTHS